MYYGSLEGGNGVVVMVNSDNFDVISEVMRSIGSVYGWKEFNNAVTKKLADVPVDTLKQYTGTYKFQHITLVVEVKDANLILKQGQENMRMYFTSGKDFVITETRVEAGFEKGEKGFDMVVRQNGREMRFLKQ